MFFVLFTTCSGAFVSVNNRESYSTKIVEKGGQSVTESSHHEADVTQVGSKVTAHETKRIQKREANAGVVTQQDWLRQAAGKKNEQDAVTKMREAMGYSVQHQGQPEKGQLTVTNASNVPGPISGIDFSPHGEPTIDTSRFSCDDGHCTQTMAKIAGKDSSIQNFNSELAYG